MIKADNLKLRGCSKTKKSNISHGSINENFDVMNSLEGIK